MKKQKKTYEKVLTEQKSQWIILDDDLEIVKSEISSIYLFFVLFSPTPQYCTQKRDLQYYGWSKRPWYSRRYLKKKLDDSFFQNKYLFKVAKEMEELPAALRKAHLDGDFYKDTITERVAFFLSDSSEYMSLFYHIRCALAHGRVAIQKVDNDFVFIMENGVNSGNRFLVKARMIIRRSTLEKWISIILSGPDKTPNDGCLEVLSMIEKNKYKTVKAMAEELSETKNFIEKSINKLKVAHVVQYKQQGRYWEIDYNEMQRFVSSRKIIDNQP